MPFQLRYYLVSMLLFLLMPLAQGFITSKSIDSLEPNLPVLRKLLVTALDSKKTTDSLYNNIGKITDKTPLLTSYLGTLEALKAKHAWNPYFKIKYLNDSEKTFIDAVAHDPHNIEIRFLRFSIEHNIPGFLGYNKNLVADKLEMIKQIDKKYYARADKALVITIIRFLLTSNRCTTAEQTDLKKHLAAL